MLRHRWIWLLAESIPWAPQVHFLFPPAFRAAAQALLLANHRGFSTTVAAPGGHARDGGHKRRQRGRRREAARRRRAEGEEEQLVQLPSAVVQQVLRMAGSALSAWLPPLPSCRLEADEV